MLKKLFVICAALAILVGCSCNNSKKTEVRPEGYYTFEQALAIADSAVACYNSATLYEVETTCYVDGEGNIQALVPADGTNIIYYYLYEDVSADALVVEQADSTTEVYTLAAEHAEECGTLVVTFDSALNPSVQEVHSPWCEDRLIKGRSFITLEQAVADLYASDIVKPKTGILTLRHALYPGVVEPEYIFGSNGENLYIVVGAYSGKVYEKE